MLDAKKRGQHHQPPAQPPPLPADELHHLRPHLAAAGGPLAGSQQMNLSTGNLALANQNGKSVSTSALPRPEASVDRWSVVMELLAQSRRKEEAEGMGGGGEHLQAEGGPGAGPKRHSKQLDKFKLAAKSAAAASKHQRHWQQQQQQQQQPQQQQPQQPQRAKSPSSPASPAQPPELTGPGALLGHQFVAGRPEASHQAAGGQSQLACQVAPSSLGGQLEQAAPNMLVQHTKSLPVGKLAPGQQTQPSGELRAGYEPAQQQLALGGPGAGHLGPAAAAAAAQQQQAMAGYQLLNISQQQLQSTSGE